MYNAQKISLGIKKRIALQLDFLVVFQVLLEKMRFIQAALELVVNNQGYGGKKP